MSITNTNVLETLKPTVSLIVKIKNANATRNINSTEFRKFSNSSHMPIIIFTL